MKLYLNRVDTIDREIVNHLKEMLLRSKIATLTDKIEEAEIIYTTTLCDVHNMNKIYIYDSSMSIYPFKLEKMKNIICVHSCNWIEELWSSLEFKCESYMMPYSINTDYYCPGIETRNNEIVFIYYMNRSPRQLEYIKNKLDSRNISYRLIEHDKYNKDDFLSILQESKYGIWLTCHQTFNFELMQALSCNIPAFVCDVKNVYDKYNSPSNYYNINQNVTCKPYWDNSCGEFIIDLNDFDVVFTEFIYKLQMKMYNPRSFIMKNHSIESSVTTFTNMITHVSQKLNDPHISLYDKHFSEEIDKIYVMTENQDHKYFMEIMRRLYLPKHKVKEYGKYLYNNNCSDFDTNLINIIREAKENNYKTIMVIDYKVSFISSFNLINNNINTFFDNFNNDWDFINLSSFNNDILCEIENINFLKKAVNVVCNNGCIVNSRFYDQIINEYQNNINNKHDVNWTSMQLRNDWFVFNPSLILETYSNNINNNCISINLSQDKGKQMLELFVLYSLAWLNDYYPIALSNCEADTILSCFNINVESNLDAKMELTTIDLNICERFKDRFYNMFMERDVVKSYFPSDKYGDIIVSIYVTKEPNIEPNMQYYENATKYIGQNHDFIILSNDIEWCKNKFDFIKKKRFAQKSCGAEFSIYEQIDIMSRCNHNIISDAYIAYIGASLNNYVDRCILYPESERKLPVIINNKWIKISNNESDIVTIVIPIKSTNELNMLKDSLNHLSKQTYVNYRIIIGIHNIRQPIETNNKKLNMRTSIYTINNCSYSDFMNELMRRCTTDLVSIYNPGDIWNNDKLLIQINLHETYKYNVIATKTNASDNKPSDLISHNDLLDINHIYLGSVLFDKRYVCWDNSIYTLQDYNMWLQLSFESMKIFMIDTILVETNNVYKVSDYILKNYWKSKTKTITVITKYRTNYVPTHTHNTILYSHSNNMAIHNTNAHIHIYNNNSKLREFFVANSYNSDWFVCSDSDKIPDSYYIYSLPKNKINYIRNEKSDIFIFNKCIFNWIYPDINDRLNFVLKYKNDDIRTLFGSFFMRYPVNLLLQQYNN